MASRVIRSGEYANNSRQTSGSAAGAIADVLGTDHLMSVEKQAFEQGYKEGERIGKQMGERMMDSTGLRYERSIQGLAKAHRDLTDAMEVETVRLSLEIARKIVQREVTVDPELIGAMVSIALKRVHGNRGIGVRVSSHDYGKVCEAIEGTSASIQVKEDTSLERGDFIVDSVETHLDGRISSQIDAVGRALFDE